MSSSGAGPYRFLTHEELIAERGREWLTGQLHQLGQAAMSRYDGIIESTADFRSWTTSRPGQSGPSRLAAICCDDAPGGRGRITVVSSLLVTVLPLRFGDGFLQTGIVDSVMTHPDHQRRGLSRELMRRALEFMKRQRIDVSLLYTVPDTVPFRFYQSLGYEDYLRVAYLRLEAAQVRQLKAASPAFWLRELPVSDPHTPKLFEQNAECWGYTPLTEELWRWRRLERPSAFPVCLYAGGSGKSQKAQAIDPEFVFGLVRAPIRRGGGREWITLLADITGGAPGGAERARAMLRPAPPDDPVISLCAEINLEEMQTLLGAGFRKTGEESAMILPLSRRGARATRQLPPRWYTITESVTGF